MRMENPKSNLHKSSFTMLNKFIPLLMCVIFLSDKFKTFNATKFKNILLNHDTCLQISQFKGI